MKPVQYFPLYARYCLQCCNHPNIFTSVRPDIRYEGSDRYTLTDLVRMARQTLDSIDMFIIGKGKAPASTNGVEAYNKEAFVTRINELMVTNI